MSTRDLWNRYARYFNAEEGIVFPADQPELDFYTQIRKEYTGSYLEIGAGSGRLAGSLEGQSAAVALEPSDLMLAKWSVADRELALRIQGTGERMPFRSDSFPFACFPYNGLQCVPEEEIRIGIIKEAFRVTAPGGVFLLEVSPVFARRESEPLTERYCAKMPDGTRLVLREKVERRRDTNTIKYHMFYTTIDGDRETTEEITLELAVISRDQIISLLKEAGFCDIIEWGNYDRSPYDNELSPRLLVLAVKGIQNVVTDSGSCFDYSF
ncbi:MAG: class I SAM-dependent methyltransferase [Candidatus Sabulitectum sp.]|nr:class I SAM-dependent methyltransferase [Candidatus Sabulitectum sp.]